MLANGIIEPSTSEYSSPPVLVERPGKKPRFCVDYRKINAITKSESSTLPKISEVLKSFGEAKIFSVLDLKTGYWQIPMQPESKKYTAFSTPDGATYQFNVLPFGLKNNRDNQPLDQIQVVETQSPLDERREVSYNVSERTSDFDYLSNPSSNARNSAPVQALYAEHEAITNIFHNVSNPEPEVAVRGETSIRKADITTRAKREKIDKVSNPVTIQSPRTQMKQYPRETNKTDYVSDLQHRRAAVEPSQPITKIADVSNPPARSRKSSKKRPPVMKTRWIASRTTDVKPTTSQQPPSRESRNRPTFQ
ncbi:uncharacterized protein LOC111691988 [Anoplophora glabripennis]|uniref:uncharacterized protein LOC111691988 n=1 Tax=Anoplophora glabripennis TaxID=217634 RepID=UPI000C7577BE|nr:uncharacterized protein LOC111691988 [Anoplophora glabripennis]